MMRSLVPCLAFFLYSMTAMANQSTATVELQFIELDEADYEVVREELLATRLPGDYEGLNRSQVPAGFWKKVQTFPGSELLSAPKVSTGYGNEAKIEISDLLEVKVVCSKAEKGIGVDLQVKMKTWKKGLSSNVTLPENVQAMVGSLSNSEGRRVLVLCKVFQAGATSAN